MTTQHQRLRRDLAAVAIVVALAVSEAAQVYVGLALQGGTPTWALALRSTGPSWVVLLLLVLPLLRLLDRHGGGMAPARLAALTGVGVVFTALHLAGTAFLAEVVVGTPLGFRAHFYQLATVYFVTGMLTFVAVVTLHDGVRRYRAERSREVQAARVQADVAEARYHALRGQLRPDFFFNTLNAVAGLVARGEVSRSVDALSSLSALLRVSLSPRPGRAVPLEDEMELVAGYLSIQALRFPDRLVARTDTAGSAGACAVPALLLVQLVEGVVDRGLEAGDPFSVNVTADEGAGRLRVTVLHSAPPPDAEVLEAPAARLRRFDGTGALATEGGTLTLSLADRRVQARRGVPAGPGEVTP